MGRICKNHWNCRIAIGLRPNTTRRDPCCGRGCGERGVGVTTEQIESERVAFEAWYALPMDREGTGYRHDTAQDMWRGWLARAELIHANQQAAEALMERQESQRVAMAEKHERGE